MRGPLVGKRVLVIGSPGGGKSTFARRLGKLLGLPLNRALTDPHGMPYDIVCGTFFLTGVGEEHFTSLTGEQLKRYQAKYSRELVFTATDRAAGALLLSALRGFILVIPLALILQLLGVTGIWLTVPAAELLTALTAIWMLRRCRTMGTT